MRYLMAMLFALGTVSASAQMNDGPGTDRTNERINYYSAPDEVHLFDGNQSEAINYDGKRRVEICAGALRNVADGLEVMHGNQRTVLKPGDCQRFTAQDFRFSPAGNVEQGWTLQGSIQDS